jgi:hypothetical protein
MNYEYQIRVEAKAASNPSILSVKSKNKVYGAQSYIYAPLARDQG